MERQAKETLLRFPYIPKKEARTVAWSNLKFISHLYLQSCKLLEHLCYTAQENYLNKAVQTHVWNVCRQTNRMSVIPFPSALWSWIHVTRSYHFRLLMLCPVHLNPPETEILQVLLNADCCNALAVAVLLSAGAAGRGWDTPHRTWPEKLLNMASEIAGCDRSQGDTNVYMVL
ncbi:uncharacterized protein [Aphelocoma coerulescens]|uniref:uncharacterized protein isoform X5 n=1 Tax=Aphelocoma coerulescens TaxID=39617 RepID=UPI003604640D